MPARPVPTAVCRLRRSLLAACAVWLGLRLFAAARPTAFPYFARAILDVPRPLITRRGLLRILEPAEGERVLEVGPGSGYYTLPVAAELGPRGVLDIVDVRQSFLDHTLERARGRGIGNVVATLGDGTSLPFADGTFDAAYLITVLGEVSDPDTALRELRRVLKPRGRLVVGEIFIDPDFPRLGWLVKHARSMGLMLERRTGTSLAYFARLRRVRPPAKPAPPLSAPGRKCRRDHAASMS